MIEIEINQEKNEENVEKFEKKFEKNTFIPLNQLRNGNIFGKMVPF